MAACHVLKGIYPFHVGIEMNMDGFFYDAEDILSNIFFPERHVRMYTSNG